MKLLFLGVFLGIALSGCATFPTVTVEGKPTIDSEQLSISLVNFQLTRPFVSPEYHSRYMQMYEANNGYIFVVAKFEVQNRKAEDLVEVTDFGLVTDIGEALPIFFKYIGPYFGETGFQDVRGATRDISFKNVGKYTVFFSYLVPISAKIEHFRIMGQFVPIDGYQTDEAENDQATFGAQ